jgi:hypothetical protein
MMMAQSPAKFDEREASAPGRRARMIGSGLPVRAVSALSSKCSLSLYPLYPLYPRLSGCAHPSGVAGRDSGQVVLQHRHQLGDRLGQMAPGQHADVSMEHWLSARSPMGMATMSPRRTFPISPLPSFFPTSGDRCQYENGPGDSLRLRQLARNR